MKRTILLTCAFMVATNAANSASVSQDAIDACIDKLRAQSGVAARGGTVVRTEFSEANSLVMLRDNGGTTWRCLVANDGRSPSIEKDGTSSAQNSSTTPPGGPALWEVQVNSVLNVHASPSSSSPIIAKLPRGRVVENRGCLDREGRAWCEIADGDASGWAVREYLKASNGYGGGENTATADDGGGAIAGAANRYFAEYGAHFTSRDAQRACQQSLREQYGIRRSAFSEVNAQSTGRGEFWVSGKVERHSSRPDEFTCRVINDEVVSLRVHPQDKPAQSVGKAILGAVLIGAAQALADKNNERDPYPAYTDGNPFRDRSHLNKACRHEIARQLRHSHAQFDRIRIHTAHLRNRTLQGDGSIRWHDTNHQFHFTCRFDRRGQVVDGQFFYFPAQPAAYGANYADGNAGGPDAWRVADVAQNDVLWMHSGASLASPRVGSLPHDARRVRNLGCQWSDIDKATWCEVEYQGMRGFAAQRYLSEDS